MLPETIWVGPFWIIATFRPGGSGWITTLMVPPVFGSWAFAAMPKEQTSAIPITNFFSITDVSPPAR